MSLGNLSVNEYWDASTNRPKLVSGVGIHGNGYVVGTSGATALDGNSSWATGDVVVFILDKWIKLNGAGGGGGGLAVAGSDGDIQIKSGSALAALSRTGGASTDYLARDDTYKTIPSGGGGGTTVPSGNPVYQTYADARTAVLAGSLGPSVKSFDTLGYYTAGDNGRSRYVDIGSTDITQPTSDGSNQDNYRATLVVGEPAVLHDTTNSRYFLMMPRGSEVWVEQFGAQPSGWLTRINDVTPYLYKAQRYCIKTNRITNKQFGVAHVRIGAGSWYQATTFSIRGGSMRLQGTMGSHGTTFHPELGENGIVISSEWTVNGNVLHSWGTSTAYALSDNFNTGRQGRVSNSGNIYELITAGTSASSGPGPTGTGSNITDGTAHWKYIRAMVADEYRSYIDGGGSVVEDISMYSFFNPATDTFGLACGILGTSRGLIRNCQAQNMSGHGIAFMANGDPSFPYAMGNCNGWKIENCVAYYNGWSGIRVGYSDGNAGHATGLDVSTNGWFGVDDNTFLKGHFADLQSAYDGRFDLGTKKHPGAVTYGGDQYAARVPVGGVDGSPLYSTQTPGTGSWWVKTYDQVTGGFGPASPSTNHPLWVSGTIYEPGGGYAGHDGNSRSSWVAIYMESGTMASQFGPRHFILDALFADGEALLPDPKGIIFRDGACLGTLVMPKLNIGQEGGASIRIYAATASPGAGTGYWPPCSVVFNSAYSGSGTKAWITYAGGDPATFVTYL